MITADEIMTHPDFAKLPIKDQLGLLRSVDKDFAALPPKEQGQKINDAMENLHPFPQTEQENNGGVLDQAKRAVTRFGSNLIAPFTQNPLTTAKQAIQGQIDTGKKAVDQFQQLRQNPSISNAIGTLGYGAAAATPLVGPMMASSGEALGRGDYGTAAGDAATIFAAPKIGSAVGSALKAAPTFIPAAIRGGVEAAKQPITFKGMTGTGTLPAIAGGYLGYKLGHYPGAVVGAAAGEALHKVGSGALSEGLKAVEENKPARKVARAIDYKKPEAPPEIENRSGGGKYDPRLAKGAPITPEEVETEARSGGGKYNPRLAKGASIPAEEPEGRSGGGKYDPRLAKGSVVREPSPEPEARSGGGKFDPRLAKGAVVRPEPEEMPAPENRSSGGKLKVLRPTKAEIDKYFPPEEESAEPESTPEEQKTAETEQSESPQNDPPKAEHPLTQKMNEFLDILKTNDPEFDKSNAPEPDKLLDQLRESVKLVKKQRSEKNN